MPPASFDSILQVDRFPKKGMQSPKTKKSVHCQAFPNRVKSHRDGGFQGAEARFEVLWSCSFSKNILAVPWFRKIPNPQTSSQKRSKKHKFDPSISLLTILFWIVRPSSPFTSPTRFFRRLLISLPPGKNSDFSFGDFPEVSTWFF